MSKDGVIEGDDTIDFHALFLFGRILDGLGFRAKLSLLREMEFIA